jgi:hypothetical protein
MVSSVRLLALQVTVEAQTRWFSRQLPIRAERRTMTRKTCPRLRRWILLIGGVHGYFHPGKRNRPTGYVLGSRYCGITCLQIVLDTKKTQKRSEYRERRKVRVSNMSVNLYAKSVRERYIRVAQIVIMVNAGTWNICGKRGCLRTTWGRSQKETYKVEWSWLQQN